MNEHDRRNRNDNISIIIQIEEKTNELTANVVYVELKPRKKLKCNLIHKHAKICQMNVKKTVQKNHTLFFRSTVGWFLLLQLEFSELLVWRFFWLIYTARFVERACVRCCLQTINEWMDDEYTICLVSVWFGLVWLVFAKNKKFPQNTARQKENNNKQYSTEYTLRDWNSIKVSLAL